MTALTTLAGRYCSQFADEEIEAGRSEAVCHLAGQGEEQELEPRLGQLQDPNCTAILVFFLERPLVSKTL